jgi:c-di-GMP-binding flagellar brake protein YcgR
MMIAAPTRTEKIDTHTRDINERYAQRHPLQIAMCLRKLVNQRDFLTVEFDCAQIVTQLLDVDSRNARFVFDCGSDNGYNARLAGADMLTFRGQPAGIRTEFFTGRAVRTTFEGRPAFEANFPASLYYVQRREFFRVDTPLTDPFIASGRDQGGDTFRLEVQDMSLGGVALRTSDTRFAALPKGSIWKNVTLQLGGFGSVSTDLEIVAPREAFTPTGERRTVLGCRFVELRDNAERTLQRAITQLETRRLGRATNA